MQHALGIGAQTFFRRLFQIHLAQNRLHALVETGTVFANRCDYLDPALVWTGVKDTGKGGALSEIGYANLTQPKSFHLRHI